ncbi:MAG TPA: ABC transporter substrate-binding protein [Candidatus Binatia bacterium]|jgi:putative ABC transport system substrate-binding protein|nr:ABC transporter substrate-binding protein [Candidatus Binatia bacterium]
MKESILALIAVGVLWCPQPSGAQKVYRIGGLVASDQFVASIEGFKKRMAEIGYIEGKNVKYDFYNAKGDENTLKKLAQQLVQDKPDLIVTSSTTATAPVAKASAGTNIPVFFLSAGNPLRFVKSYASSGNNLTGISTSSIDLTEKRLELLKELVPGIKRVIALHNPEGENYEGHLRSTREGAKKFGLELTEVNMASEKLPLINKKLGDALFGAPDARVQATIKEIVQQAIRERLPHIAASVGDVQGGALATYAADYFALGQQGAVLVDKILKGARPTDLPIEQPSKLNLVINLATAKAIGLKIPKEILRRADEVIE